MSVLPDITLKGDNNGPAKATLGLTATIPTAENKDISIGAAFSTKTQDGLAQLLALDSTGTHLPDFGGEASFAYVGLDPVPSAFAVQHRVAVPQWDECESQCKPGSSATLFCAAVHPELYSSAADLKTVETAKGILEHHGWKGTVLKRGALLPPELLCDAGEKEWTDAAKARAIDRDWRAAAPVMMVSVGARIGYADYKWISAGSSSGELARREDHAWSHSVAARLMRRRGWLTGDGLLAITHGYQASTTTAKWCTPAGNVPRPDNTGSDAAETCRESPFGAPVESTTVQAAVFGGYFDEDHLLFRATGGVIAKITYPASGKSSFEVGPALPIYINTNLLPDEKGVFKGIVRLTPRVVYTRDDKGDTAWQFLVSLELLTGRSMFPMASDLL